MSGGGVVSVFGGPSGVREVNSAAVAALEALLEAARSGEVVGVGVSYLCFDGCASYRVAGSIGGWSFLGSVAAMQAEVCDVARGLG